MCWGFLRYLLYRHKDADHFLTALDYKPFEDCMKIAFFVAVVLIQSDNPEIGTNQSLSLVIIGILGFLTFISNCVYKILSGKLIYMLNPCHLYLVSISADSASRELRFGEQKDANDHGNRRLHVLDPVRTVVGHFVRRPPGTGPSLRSGTLLPRTHLWVGRLAAHHGSVAPG